MSSPYITHYEVETRTLCDGWVNCWSVSEDRFDGLTMVPQQFETFDEAYNEMKAHIKDEIEEVEAGNREDSTDPDDLRVVRVWSDGTREDVFDASDID